MRKQDAAFLIAVATFLAALAAGCTGYFLWAGGLLVATVLVWLAARRWNRLEPGPMSHALSWVLRLPRGPHSVNSLLRILEPRPGERLLEIGPGIGIHAIPVAKSIAPTGVLEAIDVQPAMIQDLAARAQAAGVENLVATCASAAQLPYPDAAFDAVFLISVLGEIPNPAAALKEIRRVTKPGGRLVIGEIFVDPDYVPFGQLCNRARQVGFELERKQGLPLAFLARFRPA